MSLKEFGNKMRKDIEMKRERESLIYNNKNIDLMPDQKWHQIISFIKSGINQRINCIKSRILNYGITEEYFFDSDFINFNSFYEIEKLTPPTE